MSGTYQPASGTPISWRVAENHTLIWDGQPYVPEGLRINGTPSEIAAARKAGFQDVVVDVPPSGNGWKDTIDALESGGMRYILSIDALFPAAKGFSVEPEAYRVSGITGDQHIEFPLPGATSALAVLVTERDAAVQKTERVSISDGKFAYEVKTPTSLEQVLLIYPEQSDASHPDYWEQFDAQRDILLATLQHNKTGKGFRGILNPMGKLFAPAGHVGRFVPESPYFRMEFRTYLETKYRNVVTAERAWSMGTNDLDSFEALSRLVPLWSESRGVGLLWDPSTDRTYTCEQRRSVIWTDINTAVISAAAKRFQRVVAAVQTIEDVPVLQEWTGWMPPFEMSVPEITGIAYRASGSAAPDFVDAASRPASSLLRWKSPGWLVCTDFHLDKSSDPAGTIDLAMAHFGSMGTRGAFFRTSNPDVLKIMAAAAARNDLAAGAGQTAPTVLYFPENAYNPATPQLLPSGKWWLPSPADGNRIDLGSGFYGYRYADNNGINTVLWTTNGLGRVRLRMLNTKAPTFTTSDGSDPKLRTLKTGVELTMGPDPILISGTDEMPVPEACITETLEHYQQLLSFGLGQGLDMSTEDFFYKDALASFERAPGDSFVNLRKQFWLLDKRVGRFTWVEGESSKDTNFSEVILESGCSNHAALHLHSPVATQQQGYYATYSLPIHYDGDQEVWIAARIPESLRPFVTVDVSGQKMQVSGNPVGIYSSGYGWYRLGTTRATTRMAKLTVLVNAPEGADMAIDAVLLSPGNFSPNGIDLPNAIPFEAPAAPKKRKGR